MKIRKHNKLDRSDAHKYVSFGHHAAGIKADFYDDRDIVRKIWDLRHLGSDLGSDYSISCDLEQSKALGSGYYF